MRLNFLLHWRGSARLPPTSVQAIFTEPEVFFQIGMEPVRIDIMTSVSGLEFGPAWERKVMVDFGGESAPVLCRADVLSSKIAAGRISRPPVPDNEYGALARSRLYPGLLRFAPGQFLGISSARKQCADWVADGTRSCIRCAS